MLSRLDLRGVGDLSGVLPRPAMAKEPPTQAVQAILADVRARGDAAVREHTKRLDRVVLADLRVPAEEISQALQSSPKALREALEEAHAGIESYHRHQCASYRPRRYERQGVVVDELPRPVERAGLYVPGGRARYPSTVLMTAVPARVAGVPQVALCVPPDAGGGVAATTLAAAAIAGVDEVYRVGGAQAIGAMAYGTESIGAVDVIVGPGNIYVSEAKRQVSGVVGVPSAFAGPSEVVVVADDSTPVDLAAIDVVVQAEHGPDGLAWLVTWSEKVAEQVTDAVGRLVAASPRRSEVEATLAEGGYAVVVENPKRAIDVSNAIAPEHLELLCADADSLLALVRDAGAVFTGIYAPASVGDYLAGPSHVLPTYGSARFAGALRVDDFVRHVHAISLDEGALARVAPHVAAIAEAEGLSAHAESVRLREARPAPTDAKFQVRVRDDLALVEGYHSPQVDVAVRLNTNESPIAPPRAWVEAVSAELKRVEFHRYPDRRAWELRSALGEMHGVSPEEVFCANGSNEVLQCLLLAFGGPGRLVAVFEPTYALHSHIARVTGTAVATGERLGDFRLDLDEVRRVSAEAAPVVTFLCSPNNPTGRAEPQEIVDQVLAIAPGLVVVDEAYGQFSEWSALSMLGRDDRLAVVRTFSKTWSMAATRLGYMVGPAPLVAALEQVALPYHLDTIKQVAGRLALDYQADMDKRVAALVEERTRLSAAMVGLPVESWPSDANFILFRPIERAADAVWQGLLDRSVLIRNCAGWPRLDGCLRVTVGTPGENTAFLDALAECLR